MNNLVEKQYLEILRDVKENGFRKEGRNGVTYALFGKTLRHDMRDGTFPLLTTKKMAFKQIVVELLWFLRGETNIKYLVDNGCNIWVGDTYKAYTSYPLATVEDYHKNLLYQNLEKGWCVQVGDSSVSPHPTRHLTVQEFIDKLKTDDEFVKVWGDIGLGYGKQWRSWQGIDRKSVLKDDGDVFYKTKTIDQISKLIHDLKNNPDSRRLMVSAWNPSDIDEMLLPPCHHAFQCFTRELMLIERFNHWTNNIKPDYYDIQSFYQYETATERHEYLTRMAVPKQELSLMWMQRSADFLLGSPFNLASYALLLLILSKECNMLPGELIGSMGDTHLYENQLPMMNEQLGREILPLPRVEFEKKDILDYNFQDFKLIDYVSHPAIKYPLSN